jgi:hypothetical protein
MMSIIDQLSKKTAQKFNAARAPFEEDEALINRVLDAYLASLEQTNPIQPPATLAQKPSPPKSHLPQKAFREPLLDAMAALGPTASVNDIREWLVKALEPQLSSADYEKVAGNAPRWWHFVHWNRMMLVNEGIFRSSSPHGVWELTDAGKHLINERKRGQANGRL